MVNDFGFIAGTALEFVQPGSDGLSPKDTFISRMADSLNTREAYIDVFSVLDSSDEGYVDVRYTAHGSPYYNSSRLIGAVLGDDGVSLGKIIFC